MNIKKNFMKDQISQECSDFMENMVLNSEDNLKK